MKKYKDPEATFHLFQTAIEETISIQVISKNTNNPLVYLRKLMPEANPDLLFLESSLKPLRLLLNLLKFPMIWLISRLTLFTLNLIREIARQDSHPENEMFKYLFFTHMLPVEGNKIGNDTFLSIISQYEPIADKSEHIFLSHESFRNELRRTTEVQHIRKVRRSIGQGKFLKIQIRNDADAVNMLFSAFLYPRLSLNARLLLSVASIRQLDRSCIYDEIVSENCVDYVKSISPSVFVITYEGHTFEINTIRKLQKTFPNLIILAYQHAPVVNSQFGFFQGLNAFSGNVHLLTTGEIPYQLVLSSAPDVGLNAHVVGSIKNLAERIESEHENSKRSKVLIVPEASLQAALELLSETQKLVFNDSGMNWIRLHPRLNDPYLKELLQSQYPDIKLSKDNNLEEDLWSTKLCIFRSSAVGIQGMQYGVIPIYCSVFSSFLLDPLYPITKMREYDDLGPLLMELRDFRDISSVSQKKIQRIKDVGVKYFAEPSSETLDWIANL
jgi:hypothetical protein